LFTIYKLTFASGKSYIGQTTRKLQTRITQHKNSTYAGSMLAVHCAWRLYGDPISIEAIGTFDSQEELNEAERQAIVAQKTMSPDGYNVAVGGETAPSKSPEVAAKISAKAKGRKHSENTKERLAKETAKRWEDPEYVQRMKEMAKAVTNSPEYKEAASQRMKERWAKKKADGWTMPEETKAKMRGKVRSEETRMKMSKSAKLRKREPFSEDTKKKMSENAKNQAADLEFLERRAAAISAAMNKKDKHLPANVYERSGKFIGIFSIKGFSHYAGAFNTPEECKSAVEAKKQELRNTPKP